MSKTKEELSKALAEGFELVDSKNRYSQNEGWIHGSCENGCCNMDWSSFDEWWKTHQNAELEIKEPH
jgi:hypothetical protein